MKAMYLGETAARRAVLTLFLPLLSPEELSALKDRLGRELDVPKGSRGVPSPETGRQRERCADAVRAALAAPRPTGLAKLMTTAGRAGALDAPLALELLRRARPARVLTWPLLGEAVGSDSPAAAFVRDLTDRHLGGDPDRWRAVHDTLATYRGTLPDLLAAELKPAASTGAAPPPSVPDTMGLLLEHTAPEHAAAALTGLPDPTVEALFSGGWLPGPGLQAVVADRGERRSRVALARHPRIDARMLKRLVAADDPQVNAAVYGNARCTPSLRRAIAHRIDTVPLDAGLRDQLLSGDRGHKLPPRWLTPMVGCGDPQLAGQALRTGMRKVAQSHALLRVWERRGAAAVRSMLADGELAPHLHPSVVSAVGAALDDPDGLARLRATGEPYDDPARLPHLLETVRGQNANAHLLNEPYVHDVPAIAAANTRSPFIPRTAEELARHEDATDAERDAFRLTILNQPWSAGGHRDSLTPPRERMAKEALYPFTAALDWGIRMARAGFLDPVDVFRFGHPSPRAAEMLASLAASDLLTPGTHEALRGAVREYLAGHPDAWAVLLRLLPTFPGTLPELMALAVQVAGPRPPDPAPTGTDSEASPPQPH